VKATWPHYCFEGIYWTCRILYIFISGVRI